MPGYTSSLKVEVGVLLLEEEEEEGDKYKRTVRTEKSNKETYY